MTARIIAYELMKSPDAIRTLISMENGTDEESRQNASFLLQLVSSVNMSENEDVSERDQKLNEKLNEKLSDLWWPLSLFC